jgi:tetratricopeptide (TPR) repeat protein
MLQGDWEQSRQSHKRALACPTVEALNLLSYGSYLGNAGYLSLARAQFERACEIEPTNARASRDLTSFYAMGGHYEAALRTLEQAIALGVPENSPIVTSIRAMADRDRDPNESATIWTSGLPPRSRECGIEEVSQAVFRATAQKASVEDALAALDAFWDSPSVLELRRGNSPIPGLVMHYYTWLGDLDGAYRVADYLVEHLRETGHLEEAATRPMWNPSQEAFRADPRFAAFAEGMGLLDHWRGHGWPDLWSPEKAAAGSVG